MHKLDFSYKESNNSNSVDIHIYGAIGINEEMWGDGTNNKSYALVKLIKKLDKKYDRLNVHINSPGGIISEGLAIYNTLLNTSAAVHTYNDGLTASMASIIMLAGITHFPKTSLYHLHRSSTIAIGNASDFQDEIDNLLKFEHTIKQVLSSRTNLSFSDIENFWFDGKDHFLTATEAQEFGFVDFIEDTEVVLPAPENKLQTMDYAAVLDLYGKIPDVNNNGIINNIINKLSHRHNNKNKTDMKTIKSGLLNLLFILSLDEFSFNSEKGNVEISLDDAIKLNDEVKNLQDHETELKNEAETHKNEITNLKIKVSDLQAKLDDTAQNNTNPKVNDTNTDDYDDSSINEETMTNLRAYNKLNHIQ